jgi:hypothetical protein
MNSERDGTRIVRSWLEAGSTAMPDRVLDVVLSELPSTPQRRARWSPWRSQTMNSFVKFGAVAAVVLVAVVVGIQFLPGGSNVGGPAATSTPEPTASLEASPSAPTPAPPAPSAPPLTQSFTSTMHGISVSYPEGWTARAATEPWTDSDSSGVFVDPHLDVLHDPVLIDHLFVRIASQPIGDSTPEDWVAARIESEGCTTTEPIAVGGATGLIGGEGCNVAAVETAGRGYVIYLHTSDDDPDAVAPYDRAWFEEVLATVQLHPEDAVDSGQ